jgi:hypothetical protein
MWCCFSANTVAEPTKLKPLAAEVPVAVKPVTLMFRLPSDEVETVSEKKADAVDAVLEEVLEPLDAQGEEVPSVSREECNNPCTIIFALATIAILYALMSQSDAGEL